MNTCFICKKSVDEDDYNVGAKARRKLVDICSLRDDAANLQLVSDESIPIIVHLKCYKIYSDERGARVANRRRTSESSSSQVDVREDDDLVQPSPSRHFEAAVPIFNNSVCFICERTGGAYKSTKDMRTVRTSSVKERLMNLLQDRKDDLSLRVMSKIKNVDLAQVMARYHNDCAVKFERKSKGSQKSTGRDPTKVDTAMEYIYSYLKENSDTCQFTITHLAAQIPEECRPSNRTIKERISAKFGDEVLIYYVKGAGNILCFKDTGRQLLTEAWYSSRSNDEVNEKKRVVREAGAIIREEIRSKLYPIDNYPATTDFMMGADEDVPELLKTLLEEIIFSSKRKSSIPQWEKKVTSLGHAIVKAARPRCFVSKVLLGVGCFLKKKFASRLLIDTLAAIGFSSSYSEVELLELSCISRKQPEVTQPGFSQWVADNADFNINTLDGRGSWHVMALIQCVTPSNCIEREEPVFRQVNDRRSISAADLGKIDLVAYENPPSTGLNGIQVLDLDQIYPPSTAILPTATDLLWAYGKWTCDESVPGWNGFMEQVTEASPYETSKILYLPFINSPPTDNTTIHTTLLYACNAGNSSSQKTKFVTFDQQLYWKARDIVATAPANSELRSVVVRLGGFHLMMSFMGAMGNIMLGSGLENVWSTIYAEGSIPQMLVGKAYARAVRAHTLTNLSLAKIVFDSLDQEESSFNTTRQFLDDVLGNIDRTYVLEIHNEESFVHVSELFEKKLSEFEQRGPTAKLWVQYYRMTCLLKQFLEAERTGNWTLHVTTVRKMLPFFHSSGHFNYAKSAHLYLQDVAFLEQKMSAMEFHRFTNLGFFTIRRSKKHFSGISPDQTIEQTVMRLAKSREGVTVPGRGITDNATAKWALSMFSLINICEQFEAFSGIYGQSSEQHVDMRSARVKRDNEDVEKLDSWFAAHNPFPNISQIVSIGTGIVGDETINCYRAEEEGNKMMSSMTSNTFGLLKFERKRAVKPLSVMTARIKVKDTVVAIDPMLLFHRIAISGPTTEDLRNYLEYELSPYPMSLFDECGMRKGSKSSFYDAFSPLPSRISWGNNCFHVLDGGYLLHKVRWQKNMPIEEICGKYLAHLRKNYSDGRAAVIFDGYQSDSNNAGTKSAERLRRSSRYSSPAIEFDRATVITVSQEAFLSNDSNKDRLIGILRREFDAAGFEVQQAFEDADRLIVETALLRSSEYDSSIIIGEDIDLLVLLVALGGDNCKTFLLKPSHKKTPECIYSPQSFKYPDVRPYVPFLHAFSGCDTTSAPYFQGKQKLVTLLNSSKSLQSSAQIFNDPYSSIQSVEAAGQTLFTALYSGVNCKDSLSTVRFKKFTQCATRTKVNLCSLPPSPDAAKFHSRRVYLQVQTWLGNSMEATEWGWKATARGLEPITTNLDPAPENLMKLVACGCKMNNCGAGCGCRKAGLSCSVACKHCSGENCSNVPVVDEEDNLIDDSDLDFPSHNVNWSSTSIIDRDETTEENDEESSRSREDQPLQKKQRC